MITAIGIVTTVESALDLLKGTNHSDKLLIYDDLSLDMATVGDFIDKLRAKDLQYDPAMAGLSLAIGHKTWDSVEMEVLIYKA